MEMAAICTEGSTGGRLRDGDRRQSRGKNGNCGAYHKAVISHRCKSLGKTTQVNFQVRSKPRTDLQQLKR
jgi:hypothetical protein